MHCQLRRAIFHLCFPAITWAACSIHFLTWVRCEMFFSPLTTRSLMFLFTRNVLIARVRSVNLLFLMPKKLLKAEFWQTVKLKTISFECIMKQFVKYWVLSKSADTALYSQQGEILVGSVRSHGSLRSHRSQRSHRSIMGLSAQQVFWVSLQGSLFLVLRGETSL